MDAIAALDLPKYQAEKIAERDEAVALATALRDWVHDVGDIHVALAQEAKTAADALAAGLKTAADGLTGDQADGFQPTGRCKEKAANHLGFTA